MAWRGFSYDVSNVRRRGHRVTQLKTSPHFIFSGVKPRIGVRLRLSYLANQGCVDAAVRFSTALFSIGLESLIKSVPDDA
jgi:hypothetical protein